MPTAHPVGSGRLDRPCPSAPSGNARLVEGPPHCGLGSPCLFAQLPQGAAALVLEGHELDQPPSLSRGLANRRGVAELWQHLKHGPRRIRHDPILREVIAPGSWFLDHPCQGRADGGSGQAVYALECPRIWRASPKEATERVPELVVGNEPVGVFL